MNTQKTFYNSYHTKNNYYSTVIGRNNFTYFYLQKIIDTLVSTVRGKDLRFLDVGCGVGTLAFYVANKGLRVTGIDISDRAINICNHYKRNSNLRNIEFFRKDVTKFNSKSKFDIILCSEVIEHIENDKDFLDSIYRCLNKNGYLILSTPSKFAPLFRLGMLKKFDDSVGHLRRYSMGDISNLLESSGFKVLQTKKTEGVLRNSLFTFKFIGPLIKIIRGPLVPFFHKIDEFTIPLFGESDLLLLAQKK